MPLFIMFFYLLYHTKKRKKKFFFIFHLHLQIVVLFIAKAVAYISFFIPTISFFIFHLHLPPPTSFLTPNPHSSSSLLLVTQTISTIATNSRAHQQHLFSLLQTCNSINKLIQIHTQILINGFSHKRSIIITLISLYITYGHFHHAHKLFDKMPSPTATAWNQMIRCYAHSETPYKSFELYAKMVEKDLDPDEYTYSYILSACVRSNSMLREGKQIQGRVLSSGYCSNVFIGTNLVNLYCSLGNDVGVGDAHKVFDEMPERNMETWNSLLVGYVRCGKDIGGARRVFDEMPEKSVVSWTTMIMGYVRHGRFRQGLLLFHEMRRGCVELDQASLVAALSASAELGDLSVGKWIHSYVTKKFQGRNQEVGVRLHNALVHMYASCGVIDEAYRVFREMPIKTAVSWISMIIGFAKHGFVEKALDVFKWMENCGEVRPDAVTFIGVLSACSHAGYVEKGYRYFKEMKEKWDIEPGIEHYGCMVDILSRAGFFDEAQRFIEGMPMKPNDVVWGALLGGSLIYRNRELASYAAQNLMMELDQDQIIDYLVPMSNVYLMENRWQEVAVLRKKMIELGSKHSTGQSWVQINGMMHDFVSCDNTRKHASSIYELLNRLTREVRCEANSHDMNEEFIEVY